MKRSLPKIFLFLSLFAASSSAAFSQYESSDSIAGNVAPVISDSIAPAHRMPAVPSSTPVDVDDNKPRTVLHYYDKHGNPLEQPVMFLATLDTVTKAKSKPVYPLYNGINVGVNFGDLIFQAFGQKYGSYDVWANVSIHNWIFPTVEAGLGFANDTPDHQNFTYKVSPSFYAKIGLNYNFLYKSNPDYQVFLGLRAGFSHFTYDVTDIHIDSEYWDESQTLQLKGLRATSFYGEALAGLQVKIVGGFSLGWNVRWRFNFHTSSDGANKPWFIPGYGGSSPFSVAVSAIWTIPAAQKNTAGAEPAAE